MNLTRRELMAACTALTMGVSSLPTRVHAAANSNIVKPKRLRPGMTVGLVTPASNVPEDEELHAAMDLVRSLGFSAVPATNLFSRTQ